MVADFAGHPDLPETLYLIAQRYEWLNKYGEAKRICQQITQNHPYSPYARKAEVGIAKAEVMSLVISQDYDQAEKILNKMFADFPTHPELPYAAFSVSEKYFMDAKAPDYQKKAIRILEKVMYELPHSNAVPGMYAEVYCCAGDCYTSMGEYQKALGCYQKIVGQWPDYKYAGHALFMEGRSYENLKNSKLIPESEAKLKAKAAYEQLVEQYPSCPEISEARSRLNGM
jgi:outer membrane protein assembly factor BamD (BamD/ComL family)